MNANKASKLLSTIQVLVSSILAAFITTGLVYTGRQGSQAMLRFIMDLFPEISIILGTLVPALVLRIKHRSQVAEGYLLPLFLLFLSLQTSRILPTVASFMDVDYLSYTHMRILSRFLFMSSFTILLYASMLNMKGANTSRTGINVTFSLITVFIISYIIPTNSVPDLPNRHDFIFYFLTSLIAIAALATYFVSFINDKEPYHLKRFFTFLFMSVGDFLIITVDANIVATTIGAVFFIIGAIMLCMVSPKGY